MEKITRLINEVAEMCERDGIPMLCAYGKEKIMVCEFAPDNTPELLVKARTALFNSSKPKLRTMVIQG